MIHIYTAGREYTSLKEFCATYHISYNYVLKLRYRKVASLEDILRRMLNKRVPYGFKVTEDTFAEKQSNNTREKNTLIYLLFSINILFTIACSACLYLRFC